MKNKTWRQSLTNALCGVRNTIRTERIFRVHFVVAFFALCAALYLKMETFELLFVILAVALVFTAEMFNTAIENAVNHKAGDAITPWAKAAKDAAAGAVLVTAVFSVIMGLTVFLPKLTDVRVWAADAGRALLAACVSGLAAYAAKKALDALAAIVFSIATALMFLTGNVFNAVFGYILAFLFAAGLAGGKGAAGSRAVNVALGGLSGILITLVIFWVLK